MSSFFGGIFKAVVDTALLPVDAVVDVATGAVTGECGERTRERLEHIEDDIDEAIEDF